MRDFKLRRRFNKFVKDGGAGGSGGGTLIVHQDDGGVCDHTWQEMYDAAVAGMRVAKYYEDADYGVLAINEAVRFEQYDVDDFRVYFGSVDDQPFTTDSPNGYPTHSGS